MKKVLKFLFFYLLCIFAGLGLVMVGIPVFTDTTFSEMMEKFGNAGLLKIAVTCVISILMLFAAIFLQIIIHEGGHLVTGLLNKFKFVSFRVCNLTLIKEKGKFKIKKFFIQGTGGQCLLSPPDNEPHTAAVIWYFAGGVMFNLITAAICFAFWFSIEDLSMPMHMFLIYMWIAGVLLGLMNGIPLKMNGVTNDGYNIILLNKDSKWISSLMAQLYINAATQEGVRFKDMPEEWFNNPEITDYKNIFQVGEKQAFAARLIDQERFEEAHVILNELHLHEKEIIAVLAKEIACDLLFIELHHYQNNLRADELYTDDLKKYVLENSKMMSSKQLVRCAWAHYIEDAFDESKAIYEKTLSMKNNYLMLGEVESNLEMMEKIVIQNRKKQNVTFSA